MTVIGARPQFIKASVVSNMMKDITELHEIIVHTGQHYDENMSRVFFDDLNMEEPNYHLNISGGSHGVMTGKMLMGLEELMKVESPDIVLVYGDTNSTLAGALAAVKLHIPVAHVEAGLRSFNMKMPEEINRIITDRISTWLFPPTKQAVSHLLNEGVSEKNIVLVGDVMYDVALFHGERVDPEFGLLKGLNVSRGEYLLATIHRAENTDEVSRIKVIVNSLNKISDILTVVWPLHPRTRNVLHETGLINSISQNVKVLEPVGYLEMVQLEKYAKVIVTDSGGVQKEAFFYKVPCVTLRDETEWVELVESGWNKVVSPIDDEKVVEAIRLMINNKGHNVSPYGEGDAAEKIIKSLVELSLD